MRFRGKSPAQRYSIALQMLGKARRKLANAKSFTATPSQRRKLDTRRDRARTWKRRVRRLERRHGFA